MLVLVTLAPASASALRLVGCRSHSEYYEYSHGGGGGFAGAEGARIVGVGTVDAVAGDASAGYASAGESA